MINLIDREIPSLLAGDLGSGSADVHPAHGYLREPLMEEPIR